MFGKPAVFALIQGKANLLEDIKVLEALWLFLDAKWVSVRCLGNILSAGIFIEDLGTLYG